MQTWETTEVPVSRAELALVLNGESSQVGVRRQVAGGAKSFQEVKNDRGMASARCQDDHLGLGKPGADLAASGRDR